LTKKQQKELNYKNKLEQDMIEAQKKHQEIQEANEKKI